MKQKYEFSALTAADVPWFLNLATREQWVCDPWEFAFLLRIFPHGCMVVRAHQEPVAFITSISYGNSGWIGNLLVDGEHRGKGLGRTLMERALAILQLAGVERIWLTASSAGRPIYERLGFTKSDEISRWKGRGLDCGCVPADDSGCHDVENLDATGWGDPRESLLTELKGRGPLFATPDQFLLVQHSC
jgi:ribosomal protein S18 acetylase RimI-like enzyme